ncbi:DUF4352 domain-containing protein [Paenibacillus dendritiformis]|uniref:DUF4352 domain-containing protein n=1 Tax=Paenibacillus dendritiformis TaxID=130049 RepID=UPI00387E19C0
MKKPIFKRWWFWLIVVIVVFAAIGSQGNKEGNKETVAVDSGTGKEDVKPAQSKPETKEETKEPQLKSIGEELQVGDVVFKVNKISTVKEIKDGQFLTFKPDSDDSVFFIVNVTVKNSGKKMINTDSSFFQLKKGEVTYAPTTLITTSREFFLYEGINPGLSKTGNIAFEVPKDDATDYILNVQTGFWGTEQGEIELK